MPNNNYLKAAAYERACVKHLIAAGAIYATRKPGSKTPIDVIAIFPKGGDVDVHLVQCKMGSALPKWSEIDFMTFMEEKGCTCYYLTPSQSRVNDARCERKYQRLDLDEAAALLKKRDPSSILPTHPDRICSRKK